MHALNVAKRYQTVRVETSSPIDLVVMLFDGITRFTREAEDAMRRKDRARAGERIGKAHAILEELVASLDPDKAPELCETLVGVYGYCMKQLIQANLEQSPETLAEVREVLSPIREAWAELAKNPPPTPT
ncbi:MAG: flagellar export chaperone FliS [Myxococcales bacterium]|jgi:flagellar protein FliS|nr:flagellar export chaperone FliS [Myxococcales bacterium]